jgi:hypothetical protein
MSTIITRNSATSGSVPSSLIQGELAINVTDGRLFYGSGSGNIVKEFVASGSGGGGTVNTGSFVTTSSFNAYTGSSTSQFAGTASFALNVLSASYAPSTPAFPFTGSAKITGSLGITGSLSNGTGNIASGLFSHAEGLNTQAKATGSHAEGLNTISSGSYSHAEGQQTISIGGASHAEGKNAIASGNNSHAEGYATISTGDFSHTEGQYNIAVDQTSHAEGSYTIAGGIRVEFTPLDPFTFPNIYLDATNLYISGDIATLYPDSIVPGNTVQFAAYGNAAVPFPGDNQLILLQTTITSASYDTYANITTIVVPSIPTIGSIDTSSPPPSGLIIKNLSYSYYSIFNGAPTHTEGYLTTAPSRYSHAEGTLTNASGEGSHAEGAYAISSGSYSHAEGDSTISRGDYSHAEGGSTNSTGPYSHAEGDTTTSTGDFSHAEGSGTTSTGDFSHAEGNSTTSIGNFSHAEGSNTNSLGSYSHAEGDTTTSTGDFSHAEGESTNSYGTYSHAEGLNTTAGQLGYTPRIKIISGVFELDPGYGDLTSLFTPGVFILIDDVLGEINGTPNIFKLEVASSTYTGTPATEITLVDTSINISTTKYTVGIYSVYNPTLADASIGSYSHTSGDSTHTIGIGSSTEGYFNEALGYYQSVVGIYNEPINDYGAFIIGGGYDNTPRNLLVASPKNQIVTITGSATTYKPLTTQENISAAFIVSGEIVEGVSIHAGVTLYDLVSLDNGGDWITTVQTQSLSEQLLGIYIGDNKVLLEGYLTFTDSTGNGPFVGGGIKEGQVVYIQQSSSGLMSVDIPSSFYVRTLGHVLYHNVNNAANWTMKFNPSNDWITI